MGYTKSAFKGFSWIGGIRVVSRVLTLIETAITGRILSPSQFGVFGIGLLVLALIEIITETGINIFLVQEKEDIDAYIDTAWIVSLARGIIIAIVLVIAAPFVAAFFHAQAVPMLLLVAIVPLIRGFINPAEIKFQKELQFHKEFYFRSVLFFIETAVTLVLILFTHSVYSLVWGIVASAVAECILSFRIVRPTPKFHFVPELFQKVIHFGKWVTMSTVLNYFYQNGDNMAVGRMLGTTQLGFYDMAYRISLVPITDIADTIKTVSFPLYVKIADDKKRLRRAYLRTLSLVLLLVIPASAILYFFPQLIISVILGNKWLPAVPVLRVLAVFGVVRAVSTFSSALFLSAEHQRVATLVNLIGLAGLGITIIPFVMQWGIIGAALAALLGTTLTIPFIGYFGYTLLRD